MATRFSDQAQKLLGAATAGVLSSEGTPGGLSRNNHLQPDENLGRVRILRWSYTVGAAGLAINDVAILGKLPANARVIQGREFHSAMSTGAGAATAEIGTYNETPAGSGVFVVETVAQFLAATSVDAPGQNEIANTLALGALDILPPAGPSAEKWVGVKATVEAWAAAGNFEGYLLYVVD